jgi:hypothetical protein
MVAMCTALYRPLSVVVYMRGEAGGASFKSVVCESYPRLPPSPEATYQGSERW